MIIENCKILALASPGGGMFGTNNDNGQTTANNSPTSDPTAAPVSILTSNPISEHDGLTVAPLAPQASSFSAPVSDNSDLVELKQKALNSLTPMVDKLEQSPEEKFKTLMMLIQASDNSSLVKDAYAAAEQITDEKARAQALIDIVNEINYFTSKT